MYGEQIALTYKGEAKYKSVLGAIVTLLVIMIMMAFCTQKLSILTKKEDPTVIKQTFMRNLDK